MIIFLGCKNDQKQVSIHEHTNDLIHETSPYLLQHAHNPVDWNAWSDDVFEKAKKENKLVLISIGYSSCHWCHVMEEETFTNEEAAQLMNSNFINIKVDREERPDVDKVYMTALQLMTGSGGWPLNVIVLPNGKPIYGGTYHTTAQWKSVLEKVHTLYTENPLKANEYADKVALGIEEVSAMAPKKPDGNISKDSITASVNLWKLKWDKVYGGDLSEQKFMLPTNLGFLMDYSIVHNDMEAQTHVKNTLDNVANSGTYDQVGGGFFRYSTARDWSIPHFEKMLYDNAQAISLYSKAYKRFKDPKYEKIVYATIDFLEQKMKSKTGGFFSAMNADSEGEEGKYYVWSAESLQEILGDEFDLFSDYYRIDSKNSLENGKYILQRTPSDLDFAKKHRISVEEIEQLKDKWKSDILRERNKRIMPTIDDKIITSWNCLLINGYLEAYKAFGEQRFLKEAVHIFEFIKDKSLEKGTLIHSYKAGGRKTPGFLEDYTALVNASINLYAVTLDEEYLEFSKNMNTITEKKFRATESSFYTYNEDSALISDIIPTQDGIMDSPNAVMAENFFLLSHIDYDMELLEKSKEMVIAMTDLTKENPESFAKWNMLSMQMANTYYEVAVVGPESEKFIKDLHKLCIPNTFILGTTSESTLEIFENRYMGDQTFIYVCLNNSCKLPVDSVKKAVEQINYVPISQFTNPSILQ